MKTLIKILSILLLFCYSLNGFTQSSRYLEKLYWTDTQYEKIQRSNYDGTEVEDVITNIFDPRFIIPDNWGKFYFSHDIYIKRANMDGSEVETVITTVEGMPTGLALEYEFGTPHWIYWADNWHGTISKAKIDGTNITVIIDSIAEPYDMAIDGDEMYWSEEYFLCRANLDGSNVEAIFDMGRPRGLILDELFNVIYFADNLEQRLHRINYDGSDHVIILEGRDDPRDIGLEVYVPRNIFWTEYGGGNIQYASGTGNLPVVLVSGLGEPLGIMAYIDPSGSSGIDEFEITGSWPNPASGSTTISYTLMNSAHVFISVCDNRGKTLDVLADAGHHPGKYQVTWNRNNFPSGIYFYIFRVNNQQRSGKILVID